MKKVSPICPSGYCSVGLTFKPVLSNCQLKNGTFSWSDFIQHFLGGKVIPSKNATIIQRNWTNINRAAGLSHYFLKIRAKSGFIFVYFHKRV